MIHLLKEQKLLLVGEVGRACSLCHKRAKRICRRSLQGKKGLIHLNEGCRQQQQIH